MAPFGDGANHPPQLYTIMNYTQIINNLFRLLELANASDSHYAKDWQREDDASQSNGMYGDIHNAIKKVAGSAILDHWCDTGEVDYELADRQA